MFGCVEVTFVAQPTHHSTSPLVSVVATTLACRIMPSRNGGSSAPSDAVLGVLQLLSEDNKEMHRYNIHKTTTTMGRALTNDVRLLLEDVSRQHCTIEFCEENDAVLHVLGSNGVWHNDVHMKPNTSDGKRIHLANGDKVKISAHTLLFSYIQRQPKPLMTKGPARSEATAGLAALAKLPPTTPRRQSARLRARASMPSLPTAWTPQLAKRPIPLVQQAHISQMSTTPDAQIAQGLRAYSAANKSSETEPGTPKATKHKSSPAKPNSINASTSTQVSHATQRSPSYNISKQEVLDTEIPEGPSQLVVPSRDSENNDSSDSRGIASVQSSLMARSTSDPDEAPQKNANADAMNETSSESSDKTMALDSLNESVKNRSTEQVHSQLTTRPAFPVKSQKANDSMETDDMSHASGQACPSCWNQPSTSDETDFSAPVPAPSELPGQDIMTSISKPTSNNQVQLSTDTHVPSETTSPLPMQDASDQHTPNPEHKNLEPSQPIAMPFERLESDLTLCFDALEEAQQDAQPPASSTPLTTSRYPQSSSLTSRSAMPITWSPEKTRKVSLRTATLLKRSSQYPIVPLSPASANVPTSPSTPPKSTPSIQYPTSTGSKDMDLSLRHTSEMMMTSSDEEDEAEVESSFELQIAPKSPEAISLQRPNTAPFLTPQARRMEKPAVTRRLSCADPTSPRRPVPALKHRSSWVWLKDLLSPSKKAQQPIDKPELKQENESGETSTPEAQRHAWKATDESPSHEESTLTQEQKEKIRCPFEVPKDDHQHHVSKLAGENATAKELVCTESHKETVSKPVESHQHQEDEKHSWLERHTQSEQAIQQTLASSPLSSTEGWRKQPILTEMMPKVDHARQFEQCHEKQSKDLHLDHEEEFFDASHDVQDLNVEPKTLLVTTSGQDASVLSGSLVEAETRQASGHVPQTPDMRDLKHMFAEPKYVVPMESAMGNFRHLMNKQEQQQRPVSDVSLSSAWTMIETGHYEDDRHSLQRAHNMPPSQRTVVTANGPITSPTTGPTPETMPIMAHVPGQGTLANELSEARKRVASALEQQDPSSRKTSLPPTSKPEKTQETRQPPVMHHHTDTSDIMKHRVTRSVPKKEPYVPVRRQLPPRNAVKMSRIGSLSTSATRGAGVENGTAAPRQARPLAPTTRGNTGVNTTRLPATSSSSTSSLPIARGTRLANMRTKSQRSDTGPSSMHRL